jgi:hypothetical protein
MMPFAFATPREALKVESPQAELRRKNERMQNVNENENPTAQLNQNVVKHEIENEGGATTTSMLAPHLITVRKMNHTLLGSRAKYIWSPIG